MTNVVISARESSHEAVVDRRMGDVATEPSHERFAGDPAGNRDENCARQSAKSAPNDSTLRSQSVDPASDVRKYESGTPDSRHSSRPCVNVVTVELAEDVAVVVNELVADEDAVVDAELEPEEDADDVAVLVWVDDCEDATVDVALVVADDVCVRVAVDVGVLDWVLPAVVVWVEIAVVEPVV